jgi:hypothetical protein
MANQSLRPERGSLAFQTPATVKNSRRLIVAPFAWSYSPLSSLHSASQLSRAINVVRPIHLGPAPRRSTSMLATMHVRLKRIILILLALAMCIVINFEYYNLNIIQRKLVCRFGCGCVNGFNTNTITALVIGCSISLMLAMIWIALRVFQDSRYIVLIISFSISAILGLRLYWYSSWL